MDLQVSLTRVTRHLLRGADGDCRVFLHRISPASSAVAVVCAWQAPGKEVLKGTGVGFTWMEAYCKAVVELGEGLVVSEMEFEDRAGLAGGVFLRTALQRARCELLERDAFLFHWRSGVPFFKPQTGEFRPEGIELFGMESADSDIHCILATDALRASGGADCLTFGMGAHPDPVVAARKAEGEYRCAELDHRMRPGWCARAEAKVKGRSRLADFHHAMSRDARVIGRFRALCGPRGGHVSTRAAINEDRWVETEVLSPLRYFKFGHVKHAELVPLVFGVPEPGIDGGGEPLYHPVW